MSPAGEKRIRLKDIAQMVGVDLSLVSRVVNHNADGEISEAKRKKIEKIIRETGYVPSSAARSLATRKTRQLMFIFSDNTLQGLANAYFGNMLHGFSDACAAHKYNCILNILDCSDISAFVLPENLKNYSVDGCAIAGFANHPLITHLDKKQHPVVMIEPSLFYEQIPIVNRKDRKEIPGLLDFFRRKKYRKVWMSEGFFQPEFLNIKDLEIKKIDDYKREVEAVAEFFAGRVASLPEEKRPDLLVCRGHIALHLLRKLKDHGLKCPEDIALMSTSDFEANQFCTPALSTVVQDSREMGRYAGELLYRICTGIISREAAVEEARNHQFPVQIKERESTGSPVLSR